MLKAAKETGQGRPIRWVLDDLRKDSKARGPEKMYFKF